MKKKVIKLTKEEIRKANGQDSLEEERRSEAEANPAQAGDAVTQTVADSPDAETVLTESQKDEASPVSLWDEVDGVAAVPESKEDVAEAEVKVMPDRKTDILPETGNGAGGNVLPARTTNSEESAESAEGTGKKKRKSYKRHEEKPVKKKMTKEQLRKHYRQMLRADLKVLPFLLPSLIGVIMFYLAPFGVAIFYAFVDNPITKNFVGFQNIISVFKNGSFRLGALNTLKFSFMAVPLAVVISLLLAIMLNHKIPLASEFRTSFLSPLVVPVASVVLVFQVFFNFNGVANLLVTFFGGDKIDWLKSAYAPYVVLILFLWKNLGYNMILFLGALGNIPQDALEVAYLDTNNEWKIFWLIKIRYLSPTLLFATIISLINSFKVFREVYLLTGSYPVDSIYILQNYMNNMFDSMDYQKLSSAAIIMSIVMVVIIGGLYVAENRFGKDMEE